MKTTLRNVHACARLLCKHRQVRGHFAQIRSERRNDGLVLHTLSRDGHIEGPDLAPLVRKLGIHPVTDRAAREQSATEQCSACAVIEALTGCGKRARSSVSLAPWLAED